MNPCHARSCQCLSRKCDLQMIGCVHGLNVAFSAVFKTSVLELTRELTSVLEFALAFVLTSVLVLTSVWDRISFLDFTPVLDFPSLLELTSVIVMIVMTSSETTAACGEVGYMLLVYGTSILWMFSLQLVLLMNSLHSDALVGLFHFQPQSMKLSLLDTSLITSSHFRADNTMTVKWED